mmetsp:Transcript_1412/g.3099  ORF Transcript_1412/g.3099 Transcript_1412/m.3099 type:complete len:83 (+) Transcript_1412:141-389(+)
MWSASLMERRRLLKPNSKDALSSEPIGYRLAITNRRDCLKTIFSSVIEIQPLQRARGREQTCNLTPKLSTPLPGIHLVDMAE